MGKSRGLAGALDEARTRESGKGLLDGGGVFTDARNDVFEGRGASAAREAEEGAEDVEVGAHGCHYVQH